MRLRPFLTHSGAFLAGAVLAALLLSAAWALSLGMVIESATTAHIQEQVYLRDKARRENDVFAQIIHAINVAHLSSGHGLVWSERWLTADTRDLVRWPIDALSIRRAIRSVDPEKLARGERLITSTEYGRAALALERGQFDEQAAAAWARARELAPELRPEQLRPLAENSLEGPFAVAVETAYLRARTDDELEERLAAIRSGHYDQEE